MKYLIILATISMIFPSICLSKCSVWIDQQRYSVEIDNDVASFNNKTVQYTFIEEYQDNTEFFKSNLSLALSQEYVDIVQNTPSNGVSYALDKFFQTAIETISGPEGDLITPTYRIHGYYLSKKQTILALIPNTNIGLLVKPILKKCR